MRKASVLFAIIVIVTSWCARGADDRPAFPELTLTSLDGQTQRVADYRGTVTVVNFWATWCGPCRMELPELQKIYNDLAGKGFVVAAVNVEGPSAPVRPFMQRMNLSLPVFFVTQEDQRNLGISSIPFTVLLDRQGRVVRVYPGFSKAGMLDLRDEVGKLLGESAKK